MAKVDPDPYVAIALQPSFKGCYKRTDIQTNLKSIKVLMEAAVWMSTEVEVRLITLPEGALQGFNDEIEDRKQSDYANKVAIDIPGPETDALGKLAKQFNAYIIAQAKGKDPNFIGYFFNFGIIISPDGEVIHQAAKNVTAIIEGSASPHALYDRWVEIYGNDLNAFFPVCDTPIGRIGTMICYEGMFSEPARGLALNGAEIIYHPSAAVTSTDMGAFELVNRARAFDNNCYVIAPNSGLYHYSDDLHDPLDVSGGHSMIVDYRGKIIGEHKPNTNSWASAVIDIRAQRHFRKNARMRNWLKEVRTEIFQTIYERPIYEKNFYLDTVNKNRDERIKWAQIGAKRVAPK
jgi:predicted amidohydrolase